MSSDLCKKTTSGGGGGGGGGKPTTVLGCTDPNSLNYNPNATKDDGSCKYADAKISGKSLRSKHLSIICQDLYVNPSNQGDDPLRIWLFNNFKSPNGKNLIETKRTYTKDQFTSGRAPDGSDLNFDVPSLLEAYIGTIFDNDPNLKSKEFLYVNFTLNVPFSEREVRANQIQSGRSNQDDPGFTGADPRVSTYKFEARYNFYLKEYEDKIAAAAVDVRAIPNSSMYNFLVESLYDKDVNNYDKEYLDLLSYSQLYSSALKDLIVKKKFNYNKYLEDFVEPIIDLKSDSVPLADRDKFNNLVVTQDDVVEYNQFVENDRSTAPFGFYLELPFETPKFQGISEIDDFKKILKQTNKDLDIYSILVNTLSVPVTKGFEAFNYNFKPFYVAERFIEATTNTPTINFSADLAAYRMWDFTTFFENYLRVAAQASNTLDLKADGKATIIGETNEAIQKYQSNSTYKFFQSLMTKTANAKFADTKDKKRLSPIQIFGKDGLSETPYEVLFYRIEKRDKERNPLQNYIIANPFEEGQFKDKIVKFFDTQVKYGEKYIYDVYAYPLVLAKKYKYSPQVAFSANQTNDGHYWNIRTLSYILGNSNNLKLFIDSMKWEEQNSILKRGMTVVPYVNKLDPVRYDGFIKKFYGLVDRMFKDEKDYLKKNVVNLGTTIEELNKLFVVYNKIQKYIKDSWSNLITTLKTLEEIAENNNQKVNQRTLINAINNFLIDNKTTYDYSYENLKADLTDTKSLTAANLSFTATEKSAFEETRDMLYKMLSGYTYTAPTSISSTVTKLTTLYKKVGKYVENFAPVQTAGSLNITTEDYIPLMEVKLFTEHGIILDGPPVAPQVSFVPFKDVDNRIAIKLKSQNTEYYAKPEPITKADETEIQNMIDSRGTDKQGRLLYKTDDYLSRFEIYRMDERPKSYRDFAPHLRKRVDLQGKYSSFTHHDKIEANKKYYYTFRSFDAHGHYSNPSPVYEFILNNDGGFLFPEIRIIDFETSDHFQLSTTMQKYIQIKPSSQNIILNPELIKDKNSARDLDCEKDASKPPPLGIASNGVWGKNFKLRITSKTSGKKIDINFNFEKNHKRE